MEASETLFVTGASGLLGGEALCRMLRDERWRAVVLVRSPARWRERARALGIDPSRAEPLRGDVTRPGLGLAPGVRARLAGRVTAVLHAAADVVFSRSLEDARATNLEGTRRLLELASAWPRLRRFAHVSTAFVAGRRTGSIPEEEPEEVARQAAGAGWVNAYERSKWEAEREVRAARADWIILRSSSVGFDLARGTVTQFNAVHQALRLFHSGLVPLLPGQPDTPVDIVTADWAADAIARLAVAPGLERRVFHLCAGRGAMPLGELLERSWAVWREDPLWRHRGIPEPVLASADTYALFHRSVEQTADESLKRAARALSHFSPHLALPKRFETGGLEAALDAPSPSVAAYWRPLLAHLRALEWRFRAVGAAA